MLMTCLKEMGKNNVILIADKGYSSKANREWMTKNGIMYIAPLKRDNASIDYSPLNLSTMSDFEGVFKYHGRPIFYRTVQKMGQRVGRPSKDDPNNVASVAKEHVVLFSTRFSAQRRSWMRSAGTRILPRSRSVRPGWAPSLWRRTLP